MCCENIDEKKSENGDSWVIMRGGKFYLEKALKSGDPDYIRFLSELLEGPSFILDF